jgi:hypothetical protein
MEINATSVKTEQALLVLNNLLVAQETGDLEKFSACFKQDNETVNIGTDIDEIWVGWKPFYTYMRKMIETRKGLKINAKNTNLNVSDNGDVAWYSQLIDTCIETKGDPFRLEGFRHTGVMLKINNQWKIIQSHMSIGYEPEE